jgi:chromosome segregation ATPase
LKDLEERFAEIEKRVQALVSRNKGLTGRISELEQELVQARRAAQGMEHFHGKQLHIKEKIERILQSLETVHNKE